MEALECLRSWLKIKDSEIEALIRLAAKIRKDEDSVDKIQVLKWKQHKDSNWQFTSSIVI